MRAPPRHLRELLHHLARIPGQMDRPVSGLALDSRRVVPGDLFIALAGRTHHGGEFVDQAMARGAAAVLVEIDGQVVRQTERRVEGRSVPILGIPALGQHAGEVASRFYGEPSRHLEVIGVTGTNGKTTVSQLLAHALHGAPHFGGAPCGVFGTLGYGLHGALEPAAHTTPDAVTLHRRLAEMLAAGARGVVMEVSSHALDQYRVDGVHFDTAVLTNLSHEHLDYHGDVETYGQVKRRLFLQPGLRHAVVNADDPFGRKLLEVPPGLADQLAFGLDPVHRPQVLGRDVTLSGAGLSMEVVTPWGAGRLESPLLGRFNASNLLAAVSVLGLMGVPLEEALGRLAQVRGVPGRMELVGGGSGEAPLVVVDYAHTPDALEQVLGALREHARGRLWVVFGCGGERDQGKRRVMGDIAERLAQRVVVTWDNPRREDPGYIVGQILGGMERPEQARVVADRAVAIAEAIGEAGPDDVVLIAGKGHEDHQIVGDQRRPFSDVAEARRALGLEVRGG